MKGLVAFVLVALLSLAAMLWLRTAARDVAAGPERAAVEPARTDDAVQRATAEPALPERAEVERSEPEAEPVAQEELDEPPEEEADSDPVQLGPALLDLRLIDARTDEPVASQVELWRIDAPGNDAWTDGDQLQQSAHVPVDGWVFTHLPEGRYRLVCDAAVWNAQPPEITVSAPRTQLDVPIEVPVSFRVRVVVRDRYGRLVPGVLVQREQPRLLQLSEPWRFDRAPREGFADYVSEEVSVDLPPRASVGPQSEDGFDLGGFRGAQRGSHQVQGFVLETPDGARVHVAIPTQAEGNVDLVAVAVPPGDVLPGVRVPAGADGEPMVEVVGEAVAAERGLPLDGWDHAPVRILVGLAGCESKVVSWTVADGDLPLIELERGP